MELPLPYYPATTNAPYLQRRQHHHELYLGIYRRGTVLLNAWLALCLHATWVLLVACGSSAVFAFRLRLVPVQSRILITEVYKANRQDKTGYRAVPMRGYRTVIFKTKKKGGGEASKATTITKPEGRRSGFFMYAPGKWTNPKWEFAGARSSFAGGPVEFCRWPIEIFCQPGLVLPGGRSSFAVARSGFGRGPVEFCRRSVKFCKRHACTCS